MKKFRRKSSDKPEPRPLPYHISIPQKDPIAIDAPKKVIKALYDFLPDPNIDNHQLAFSAGDFLHVIARENATDWYEACNPLQGSRGLVPVDYFEQVGKQARARPSGDSLPHTQSFAGHDSGYAERAAVNCVGTTDSTERRRSLRSMARGTGAMVYGVVQYTFKAERPDELDAKAGEAIIVIAQSNPEWFVAKPITRLGGPGLIPVSFVEIRDMATGRAVEDPQGAIARAGVPKVEEWKKMAAEYKNSSIPLGRLDSGSSVSNLQQGMERFSISSSTRPSQDTSRFTQESRGHQRNGSATPSVTNRQSTTPNFSHLRISQTVSPLRAKVPRYTHHGDEYWFIVEAVMEDGKYWELSRNYKDFYGLQLGLIQQFPEEAGKVEGYKRTLPYMPGPLPWITEQLTADRRSHLDQYLRSLLAINPQITSSHVVRVFFHPRDGDRLMVAESETDSVRYSVGSQRSSIRNSRSNGSTAPTVYTSPPRVQHTGMKQSPGHYRGLSESRIPNGATAAQAWPTMQGPEANSSLKPPTLHTAASASGSSFTSGATVKIKVWFGDANCVVIRMPNTFNYEDLVLKLRERWSLEPDVDRQAAAEAQFLIEYKDEATQSLWQIGGDGDLAAAQERNEKLTLRVSVL